MIVLCDYALPDDGGQWGLKHVQVHVLWHYCDSDQVCAFVGLQCGNQNNRWPCMAKLRPQRNYIHKKLKKKTLTSLFIRNYWKHCFIHSGGCYNEWSYKELMLQQTVFILKKNLDARTNTDATTNAEGY
jgi:hypothetical protein